MTAVALWRPNPFEDFVQRHQTVIWTGVLIGGAFATGALIAAVARRLKGAPTFIPYTDPAPRSTGVLFAEGEGNPAWPIAGTSRHSRKYEVPYKDIYGSWHGNAARAFKANRGDRNHVGMDLYAHPGDVVLAPETGTVVGVQTFYSGTDAMLIQGDAGVTALLGEIKRNSAKEFGLRAGSRVIKGQPVARVGLSNTGSHMLHFETYACCPTRNSKWYKGHASPDLVRDPTDYLLRARAGLTRALAA